jgi:hypothetical protein
MASIEAYQSGVGSLLHLAQYTRLDVAQAAPRAQAAHCSAPDAAHLCGHAVNGVPGSQAGGARGATGAEGTG